MLVLAFLITYFLSFDAMVASFIPGAIALCGSTAGMTICLLRKKPNKYES